MVSEKRTRWIPFLDVLNLLAVSGLQDPGSASRRFLNVETAS